MINKVKLEEKDIRNIVNILEKEEKLNFDARIVNTYISSKVYIDSYEESKLYFYVYKDEVVVQVIHVENRRRGTGTKLIKECAKLGQNIGVNKIRVQSVLTDEMSALCKKLCFKQDERNIIVDDKGDYVAVIDRVLSA